MRGERCRWACETQSLGKKNEVGQIVPGSYSLAADSHGRVLVANPCGFLCSVCPINHSSTHMQVCVGVCKNLGCG